MNYVAITKWFIIAMAILIGGYDVWVIISGGKDASISQVMIDYAYAYPSFPFAMGFIMGHLFWRMPESKKGE